MALSGDGEPAARATLNSGFPTSGLAVIRFAGSLQTPRPATAISRLPDARRPLTPIAAAISNAAPAIAYIAALSTGRGQQHFGDIADHLHRRGADRARHAVRPRRRAVLAVAAARRHRPVARRQDGVHHGLRPQSDPWRPPAAVRGAEVRAHLARLPRAAARRRRAALPVRGSCRGAGRRARSGRIRRAPSPNCG